MNYFGDKGKARVILHEISASLADFPLLSECKGTGLLRNVFA